jgi:hypothetical protein
LTFQWQRELKHKFDEKFLVLGGRAYKAHIELSLTALLERRTGSLAGLPKRPNVESKVLLVYWPRLKITTRNC